MLSAYVKDDTMKMFVSRVSQNFTKYASRNLSTTNLNANDMSAPRFGHDQSLSAIHEVFGSNIGGLMKKPKARMSAINEDEEGSAVDSMVYWDKPHK